MNQDNGGVIGKINTPTTSLASGVWSLDSQFDSQSSAIWPLAFPQTTFTNSCRFNDGSSDYLTKTPSGAGNRKTWTFSTWVKKCMPLTGGNQRLIACGSGTGGLFSSIEYDSSDRIRILEGTQGGSSSVNVRGEGNNRDSSAWQHVVVKYDSTQGTSADRIEIYLNGVEVTYDSTTYPSENNNSEFNNNVVHTIGATSVGSSVGSFFDGYMTEVILIDGQALAPTKFGAFNPVTNIWEPIAYAGTYGTNGFRLDFANSSALGNDVSGNDNDYTVNNLTSVDQSTDTCSNNFATMLPITKSTDATFSEGNLNVTYGTASTRRSAFGSIAVSSGKWYWETKITATSSTSVEINLGISSTYNPDLIGNALVSTNGYSVSFFPSNGSLYIGNTQDETSLGNVAVNDIIGHALDMDNGTLQFYKNGSALGSANDITTSGSNVGELYPLFTPAVSCSSGDQTFTASYNFGSPEFSISSGNSDANGFGNFEYSVPSGYFALCTKNLAEFGG